MSMKFYNELISKLQKGEPFKFSRWGDGEWGCMAGWQGENRDGNKYTPELADALKYILLSSPDYYMGIQYGVLYNPILRDDVFKWMFDTKYRLNWVNGDILHQASEFGYLGEFVDVLKKRNIIYIGADYFREISWAQHITISGTNSYSENDKISELINCVVASRPVFLISAAMNSNVIIDRLPDNVTAIDIGSVFDPYLGRPRASYQHTMKINKLW